MIRCLMLVRLCHRFLRGDQYAIALALLDEGKVVLGVLACPNLPLASIGGSSQHSSASSHDKVGCLFFARVCEGTYMQSLDGSSPVKVNACLHKLISQNTLFIFLLLFSLKYAFDALTCYIFGAPGAC